MGTPRTLLPRRDPTSSRHVALLALSLAACRSARATPPHRRASPPAEPTASSPSIERTAEHTAQVAMTLLPNTSPVDVVIHVPRGLDPRQPVHAVVFLHAATVCAAEMVWAGEFDQRLCRRAPGRGNGWAFGALHDVAHTNSVLVVPQLHTGRDGPLMRPGGFRALLAAVERDVSTRLAPGAPAVRFRDAILAAHSLGGRTLLQLLATREVADATRAVLLFDTVGDRPDVVLSWWRRPDPSAQRRLVVVHAQVRHAMRLAAVVTAALRHERPEALVTRVGDFARDLRTHPAIALASALPHGFVPYPYFTKSLVGLALTPRDVTEPWESPTPHAPIAVTGDAVVTGRLLPPDAIEGDARRYRDHALTLASGACVELTLRGGPAPWQPRGVLDTRLQVFVDGARVLDDDDGVGAANPGHELFDSEARWCAPRDVTATVRVSASTGYWHGGAYTLVVRAVASEGSSPR